MFWPDRDSVNGLDILIAGCGTNQAALLAYTNPSARIVAIDISEPSLDHQRSLKIKYGLDNLELRLLPIEEIQSLGLEFDLIVSTGVLHHMRDPLVGLKALAGCLRVDGTVAIMLYGHYGRIGVEMLQDIFKDMSFSQDDVSVRVVKDALASLPQSHPVKMYLERAHDLNSDAGIVDTFLNGRERSYTGDQALNIVESSGLVFVDWFFKSLYYPIASSNAFEASVALLPLKKQWSIMERFSARAGGHYFTACRADRPELSYRIDFQSERFLDYLPSLRHLCKLEGTKLSRHDDWSVALDQNQLAILLLVDGNHTIREILAEPIEIQVASMEQYARELFESLWKLDFLMVGLRSNPKI